MNQDIIDQFAMVSEVPALIIAAQDDAFTFKSSNTIFYAAESPDTRMIVYKGGAHGRPLFQQDLNLEQTMLNWFRNF